MSNLRDAKQKRYRKNLMWVRRRWKDAKMYVSAGGGQRVKDDRLFRAVARSAGTSPRLHQKRLPSQRHEPTTAEIPTRIGDGAT